MSDKAPTAHDRLAQSIVDAFGGGVTRFELVLEPNSLPQIKLTKQLHPEHDEALLDEMTEVFEMHDWTKEDLVEVPDADGPLQVVGYDFADKSQPIRFPEIDAELNRRVAEHLAGEEQDTEPHLADGG